MNSTSVQNVQMRTIVQSFAKKLKGSSHQGTEEGESVEVDRLLADLVQTRGEAMTDVMKSNFNKIWNTDIRPIIWTKSKGIAFPRKKTFTTITE